MERFYSLALCLFFLSGQSFAFTLNNNIGATFLGDDVKINVADHDCTNIGVTNDELLSLATEAAALYWNRVPTSRLRLQQGAIVNVSSDFQTDQVCSSVSGGNCTINPDLKVSNDILISCNTNSANYSNSPSVLGVTVPNNVAGDVIVGALILVNDNVSNSFDGQSRAEQIAILAHEIGHAVGLGHSSLNTNLMYYQSVATRVALGHDDVDGITYLYPIEQPSGGCGTIASIDGPTDKGLFMVVLSMLITMSFFAIKKKIRNTWQKSAHA